MKKLYLLFLLAFLPLLASADAVEIDGIYYNLVPKAKAAEVTSNPNYYSGDIVIPEKVNYDGVDYDVTTIGERAFSSCYNLVSVDIPNSVMNIGNSAFWACKNLGSVKLSNKLTIISNMLFSGCSALSSVTIPTSVKRIEPLAFSGCSGLSSLSIPETVSGIAFSAFNNCSGLTSITFPSSVTYIAVGVLSGCNRLKTIELGNEVGTISGNAFANCSELTDVICHTEIVPSTATDAFEGSYPEYITLHVPEGCVDAYKAVEPWSGFKEIVSIAETKYDLTYLVDGEVYKTYQLKEGETITPEPAPSKENSVFSGWSEIPETMPAHNVEITGSFSPLSDYDAIKIGTYGINSFSSSYDLDFTDVDGLKAYIAAGYNDDSKVIWLMRVNQVPANTGLLVKGKPGNTYYVPHKTTHSYYSNMLRANTGNEITIGETDGDLTNYYLKEGKLLSVNESAKIGKNKSYLQVPTKVFARTRSIGYIFGDDDTTALPQNIIQPQQTKDVYYNLNGQRVENPGKGLYIHNGKKVIVK